MKSALAPTAELATPRVTVGCEAHITHDMQTSARNHWDLYLEAVARELVINCQSLAVSEIS